MTKVSAICQASLVLASFIVDKNKSSEVQKNALIKFLIDDFKNGLKDTFDYHLSCDWDINKNLDRILKQVYGDDYNPPYKTFVTVCNYDYHPLIGNGIVSEDNWEVIVNGKSFQTTEKLDITFLNMYKEICIKNTNTISSQEVLFWEQKKNVKNI